MSVSIDSFGWIEYFSEGPLSAKYAPYVEKASPETHFTPTIVVYEVYKRLKRERGEEAALKAVAYIVAFTTLIDLDERLALNAAERSLENKLGMADAIVFATASRFGAEIVTSDPDMKGLPNVIFIK